jgi:hypothetical protein
MKGGMEGSWGGRGRRKWYKILSLYIFFLTNNT